MPAFAQVTSPKTTGITKFAGKVPAKHQKAMNDLPGLVVVDDQLTLEPGFGIFTDASGAHVLVDEPTTDMFPSGLNRIESAQTMIIRISETVVLQISCKCEGSTDTQDDNGNDLCPLMENRSSGQITCGGISCCKLSTTTIDAENGISEVIY